MAKEAVQETAPAEPEVETVGKEEIYIKIKELVKNKTGGKNIGKSGGRELFDLVVAEIFTLATKEGTIRLNGGFGSFHVRQYGSGSRRLPSGQQVEFGEREKLRYEEGVVVKALVENEGNLEEALKVRGSRAKEETPAAEPVSAKKEAPAGVELD